MQIIGNFYDPHPIPLVFNPLIPAISILERCSSNLADLGTPVLFRRDLSLSPVLLEPPCRHFVDEHFVYFGI